MPSYVYDADHSGASIAWSYFHKGIPVPTLLQYVEDGDLYRFALPDSRALLSYAYTKPQTFADWDALVTELDVLESRQRATLRGTIYAEHFSILVGKIVERAKIVRFEGYECYFATGAEFFASDVGNRLARMKPPLALIAHVRLDGLRISLRGDGSVDVSKIAQKYGGNGHPNASAFSLPWGTPLPWEALEEKTTT